MSKSCPLISQVVYTKFEPTLRYCACKGRCWYNTLLWEQVDCCQLPPLRNKCFYMTNYNLASPQFELFCQSHLLLWPVFFGYSCQLWSFCLEPVCGVSSRMKAQLWHCRISKRGTCEWIGRCDWRGEGKVLLEGRLLCKILYFLLQGPLWVARSRSLAQCLISVPWNGWDNNITIKPLTRVQQQRIS